MGWIGAAVSTGSGTGISCELVGVRVSWVSVGWSVNNPPTGSSVSRNTVGCSVVPELSKAPDAVGTSVVPTASISEATLVGPLVGLGDGTDDGAPEGWAKGAIVGASV